MLEFLLGLKARTLAKIGAAVAFIALLFTSYRRGQKNAQQAVNAETVDTVLETTKRVRENEDTIRSKSGSSADRLRKNYSRD